MGFVLGLFQTTRFTFALMNAGAIGPYTFLVYWGGFRFDLAVVSLISLPFAAVLLGPWQLRKNWHRLVIFMYASVLFLALALNLMDCAYYAFTLKRTTLDFFRIQGIAGDIWRLAPSFAMDYWYLFALGFAFAALIFLAISRLELGQATDGPPKKNIKDWLLYAGLLAAHFIAYRGGFQPRPIGLLTAAQYGPSKASALILNTPYALIRNAASPSLSKRNTYPADILDQNFPMELNPANTPRLKGHNVCFIILESFSAEYVGYLGKYKGFTPFLDSLMPHCVRPEIGMANGRKSIEALPAIFAGIPSLMNEPFVSSPYSANQINGIGSVLAKFGYHRSFFHGGQNGTMNFDVFTASAGFDHYYGLNEYPNKGDYDGHWGIPDEPFLQWYAEKLSSFPQPFVSGVFTLSSHHPFKVPKAYQHLPKGDLPILQSVAYTDHALRKFFDQVKNRDWFDSTLFVICADHTSLSVSDYYQESPGRHEIPILFFAKNLPPKRFEGIGNHIDITPTTLALLGIDTPLQFFGNNWYALPPEERYSLNLIVTTNYYRDQHYSAIISADTIEHIWRVNDTIITPISSKERKSAVPLIQRRYLSFVQQYANRMIENRLTRP